MVNEFAAPEWLLRAGLLEDEFATLTLPVGVDAEEEVDAGKKYAALVIYVRVRVCLYVLRMRMRFRLVWFVRCATLCKNIISKSGDANGAEMARAIRWSNQR